jgi:hypothetical protein
MMGRKFNVCTPRPKYGTDGESWWHTIGNAIEKDNGSITIFLNSLPLPDAKKPESVVLMLFEKDEQRDADRESSRDKGSSSRDKSNASTRSARKPASRSADEDEIPF